MALSYVGGTSGSGSSANYSISLTSLTGGSNSSPSAGDIVIVSTGFASTTDGNPGVNTSGYTELADLYQNDLRDANFSLNYKIMGSTPDTSVEILGSGDSIRGATTVIHVWRGVDQITPMDVTPTTATSPNSSNVDSPSITPITSGAVVITTGIGTTLSVDNAVTAPTGYTNVVQISTDPGTATTSVIASKAWTSGAEDPGAWTDWDTSSSESWAGATLALRPAPSSTDIFQGKSSTNTTSVTGITHSHFHPHGLSNDALLVLCGNYDNPAPSDAQTTAVTYGGNSLTLLHSCYSDPSNDSDEHLSVWFLANPPGGSNNVVTTYGGTTSYANVHVISLANVAQTGQPDVYGDDGDASVTTFDLSLTTTVNDTLFVSLCSSRNFGSTTPGGSQTQIESTDSGFWVSSYSLVSSAGSVTHSYSNGNTDDSHIIGVAIKPYSTSESTSPNPLSLSLSVVSPTVTYQSSLTTSVSALSTTLSVVSPTISTGSSGGLQIKIGSYVGNGSDDRNITGVGFDPEFVFIARPGASWNFAIIPGLTAGYSIPLGGDGGEYDDRIQALITDGFQVGTNGDTNASSVTYQYLAVVDTVGSSFATGIYTGNGTDDRNITGVGFQPDLVIVKRTNGADRAIFWHKSQGGDNSLPMIETSSSGNKIQGVHSDGFQVGTDSAVNSSSQTYAYIAFKEVSGLVAVSSYAGNGTDDRNITGLGFDPEFVMAKGNGGSNGHAYFAFAGWSANESKPMSGWGFPVDNTIQDLITDGFQVGTSNGINQSSITTYYLALTSGSSGTNGEESTTVSPVTTTLTQVSPTITYQSELSTSTSPLSITLSVVTPLVSTQEVLSVSVNSLQISLLQPTVSVSASESVTTSVASLLIATTIVEPVASYLSELAVLPSPLNITLSVITPGVTFQADASTSLNALILNITINTPTVTYQEVHTTTVSAITLTLSIISPQADFQNEQSVSPSVLVATTAVVQPTITTEEETSVQVSPIILTFSILPVVIISGGSETVVVLAVSASLTVLTPSVSYQTNITVVPSVITAALSIRQPTTTYESVLSSSVDPIDLLASVITPSVSYVQEEVISASPLSLQLTVPSVTTNTDIIHPRFIFTFDGQVIMNLNRTNHYNKFLWMKV